MSQLEEILQQIGLGDIESAVYITALKLENPNSNTIARALSRERNVVYFHIKKLVQKGVLKESRKGKQFKFIPLPPAELVAYFNRRVIDLKSIVPQLESLRVEYKEQPHIEVHESRAGYYGVYDEIASMSPKSTMRVMEGRKSLDLGLDLLTEKEWLEFHTRMAERKIETRGIFTQESLNIPKQKFNVENSKALGERIWHVRILPEDTLHMQDLQFIYGNTVAFLFSETKIVLKITHPDVAAVHRASFDALFQFGIHQKAPWQK